jgi:hypothetical protein
VVVDDVEDHLDSGLVQGFHHPLELEHLLAVGAGRGVERVRREVADRRVAPVVRQPAVVEEALVGDVVDREELDRGDAELLEYASAGSEARPGVRAAQVLAHVGVELREALHVRLVDHRLVPRRVGRRVVLPVEVRVDDDALRDRVGVVLVVELEVGVVVAGRDVGKSVREVPQDRALDRLRVRVDEELVRVEAVSACGVVRAVDAVAVALSRARRRGGSSASCARCSRAARRGSPVPCRRRGRARRGRRSP